MKTRSFLWLAAVVALGCSEAPSAPNAVVANSSANLLANFPPPPMAFYGSVSSEYTTFTGTYFLNPVGNAGWISFDSQQPAGTTITPNARISYKNGSVSGTGTIVLSSTSGGAPLTIDLKTGVIGGQWQSTCTSSCGSLVLQGSSYRENTKFTTEFTVNLNSKTYVPIDTHL